MNLTGRTADGKNCGRVESSTVRVLQGGHVAAQGVLARFREVGRAQS